MELTVKSATRFPADVAKRAARKLEHVDLEKDRGQ
jgi:hypothetical protein